MFATWEGHKQVVLLLQYRQLQPHTVCGNACNACLLLLLPPAAAELLLLVASLFPLLLWLQHTTIFQERAGW
jgi:hypothetical protein